MLSTEPDADVSRQTTAEIDYKIASTRDERAAAFRLVYKTYLQAGLGVPNPHEMRVTPYHLLPATEVFIAACRGETIFTVSLIADGELGLPMESVYGPEVALRREQGLFFGEVSCLADRRSQLRGFFPVFLRLSRLMVQYARRQGLDELLVAVHPRHERFYRRCLAFEPMGEERSYPAVRNRPAVALCLNFARIDRVRPQMYDTFFGESLPEEQLEPQPITAAQCDFFRPMLDPSFDLAPLGRPDGLFRSDNAETAISAA